MPISPLVQKFLVLLAHEEAPDVCLEVGEDLRESLFPHFLEVPQNSSPEEDLGVAQLVLVIVHL